MSSKSLQFYTQIIESLGLTIEGDMVMSPEENGPQPVFCGSKHRRVVLPTKEILKNTDWDKHVAFAPLGENTLRGESEIIHFLTTVIKVRLNVRLAEIMTGLVQLLATEALHEKFSPEQSELLSVMSPPDKSFRDSLRLMLEKIDPDKYGMSLVSFNLKRRGNLDGKQFDRLCNMMFPIMEADPKDKRLLGKAMRVSDVNHLQALHAFILPQSDVPGHYSGATNSKVAPYLVALLQGYANVQTQLNRVAELFADLCPPLKENIAELKFTKHFDNLMRMREELPVLEGNEGLVPKGGADAQDVRLGDPTPAPSIRRPSISQATANTRQPQPEPQQQPTAPPQNPYVEAQQAPQQQPVPQPNHSEGISYTEARRRQLAAQGQQPQQQQPYGYHQGNPYQQQQPMQQQGPRNIHEVYGVNARVHAYQPQYQQQPGMLVGNSPYSDSYQAPQPIGYQQQPQQQQQPVAPYPNSGYQNRGY